MLRTQEFFHVLGADSIVRQLRKQCLIMARVNSTPVSYWYHIPLRELVLWIRAHNDLQDDIQEANKRGK